MKRLVSESRSGNSSAAGSKRALLMLILLFSFQLAASVSVYGQTAEQEQQRRTKLAVLDLGEGTTARKVSEALAKALAEYAELSLVDRDMAMSAARGAGYAGSLNMTLAEARDLGAAIGSDFYIVGDAQIQRRSPSDRAIFYEAYASIFIVSARTGRLILWERPSFESSSETDALKLLLAGLASRDVRQRYLVSLRRALEDEQRMREMFIANISAPVIEGAPEEDSPSAKGLRLPAPYRRLRPAYPETAARAEVEATVDVLADIDSAGEVMRAEVARWAGFGLDEASVDTVRSMHFRPAMRDGVAIPMRVLLRYNFRKPPKEK